VKSPLSQSLQRARRCRPARGAIDRDVGEITDGHGNALVALLFAQLLDHGLGGIDPVHGEPLRRQGQRQTTGPDSELENRTRACQLGEHGDGAFRVATQHLRHAVIHLGHAVAVRRRSVLRHGKSTADDLT